MDLQLSALMLGQAEDLITGGGGGSDPFGTGPVDPTAAFKSEEQQICEALGGSWPGGAGPCQGVDTITIQKHKQGGATATATKTTDTKELALTIGLSALAVGVGWWVWKGR